MVKKRLGVGLVLSSVNLDSNVIVLTLYAIIKYWSFLLYLRQFCPEIPWNIEADVTALSQFSLE